MSNRTERREAERLARKHAYKQLRQQTQAAAPRMTLEDVVDSVSEPMDEATAPQPKPISEAQLNANRANAQHSTGPTSTAGKARSSKNAIKTGLTGKVVLLPYEDPTEYQAHLDSHINRYQPATEEESRLVQSIVDCVWRLTRVQHLESVILIKGHHEFAAKFEDLPESERQHMIEAEAYLKYEKSLRALHTQEARLRRTMEKERAELLRQQTLRRREEQLAAEQTAAQAAKATGTQPQPSQAQTRTQTANGFVFTTPQTEPNETQERSAA